MNNTEPIKTLDSITDEESIKTTEPIKEAEDIKDSKSNQKTNFFSPLKKKWKDFSSNLHEKKWLSFLIFPCTLLYMEIVFKALVMPKFFNWGLAFLPFFSLAAGSLLFFICSSFPEKVNNILAKILLITITVIFAAQIVYCQCFNKFFIFYSLGVGGAGQIIQKGILEKTIATIIQCFFPILLVCAPTIFSLIFIGKNKISFKKLKVKKLLIGFGSTIAFRILLFVTVILIPITNEIYYQTFDLNIQASYFGLLNAEVKDIAYNVFGFDSPSSIKIVKAPETETTFAPEEPNIHDPWQMDIDFDTLIKNEKDKDVLDLHKYFQSRTPTYKNEYTGMFEGYNLIYITAEGFSPYAIHEDLTPTLYKMYNKGFKFNNFYTPIWGVSTFDGEYVNNTGLIPKSGVWSLYHAGAQKNNMCFTMGRQFLNAGLPKVYAYHGHTHNYYRRDVSHPNMGYDFKAIGNGLEDKIEKCWPESDLELMQASVDEYISSEERFHAYYMTVSGHLDYNFKSNAMSKKNQEAVKDLPYSETAKAYIACHIELDKALELLLSKLEAAGVADKTLIVIAPDHYPYGLEDKGASDVYHYFSELAGEPVDPTFGIYKNALIVYSPSMIEPIEIDKYCSNLDIIPTLSNLLNLEYDSRLLMGRDILSTASPLIVFSDRSFITQRGKYDAIERTFTDFEGKVIEDDEYLNYYKTEINNMFEASAEILDNDYYGIIFGTRKNRIN